MPHEHYKPKKRQRCPRMPDKHHLQANTCTLLRSPHEPQSVRRVRTELVDGSQLAADPLWGRVLCRVCDECGLGWRTEADWQLIHHGVVFCAECAMSADWASLPLVCT